MSRRITVSLPDDLAEEATAAAAEGRAASVSAYVAEALRMATRRESLQRVLDEWDRELGVPTAEDETWAAEVVRPGRRARR